MIKLIKDGVSMAVRDKNQAAAFLNNGWVEDSEKDFSEYMNPPEGTVEIKYTKTDINKLTTAELKELSIAEGISDVDEKTGAALKKELIEHFNL